MELITPVFSEQEAGALVSQLYGLEASARLLPGERDQNFYVQTRQGKTFVLKIAPASETYDTLDLQNQTLHYLSTQLPELALPRVHPTRDGDFIASLSHASGTQSFVRLLTYIPSKLLAQTRPHTPELLHSLGHTLGRLDRALFNFSHPAAQRVHKWDVSRADQLYDDIHYIAQPGRRKLIEELYRQFEQRAIPYLPELRRSIIHADANDYNVLVDATRTELPRVIGLIDFGDMLYTNTINELAIAAAYAMLDKVDPLASARHVVSGYHQALPLTEAELEVLYPLICARLCISAINAARQQADQPHNSYLQISTQPVWALLEQLAPLSAQLAHYTFRQACALPACPHTATVVDWLTHNSQQIGRLVEPEMTVDNTLVFDLSIDSLELGNVTDFSDTEEFGRRLFARMKAANAAIGIGKYNEARPIYTAPMFDCPTDNGLEQRTIHVGLDIFMEAGTPIFAPLAGTVHSVKNNVGDKDYGPTIVLQHSIPEAELTFYTLYGHLSTDSLAGLQEGMPIKRGTLLARIGKEHENGGWPPHLHFQIISDMLGKGGEFPGVINPSEREVWLSISPDPNLIAGIPAACFPKERSISDERILAIRQKHIGSNLSISYHQPLHIVRGYRQYLYTDTGRHYLDAVNNVAHVGHNHPHVVQAGQRQMAILNTNTRYLHENLVRYAERLCAMLPPELSVCYFVCSGSEANELALRLARAHSRQKDIIVVDTAYHGNTTTLIDISPYKFDGPGGTGAPPYVHVVPLPDSYRGLYRGNQPQAGERYARHIAEVIARMQQQEKGPAAFICESIGGCAGQVVLPEGYLQAAYQHVRQAGGVCIADEVQTGFGRAGSHFWAFETQGVVPDIVTMGKPIGNGHPLGAVVTTQEIAATFDNGMEYFNTFGGNPVSCAIGMAVLDVIEQEQLQENARKTGAYLLQGLRELQGRHPLIGDVRGLGLFIGVELVLNRETLEPAAEQAAYIANRMRDHGILISTDGPLHNALKIKPPIVFDEANADLLIAALDKILGEDFVQV
ncbi:aminotransferase class III-fold pyridoxal phosphate-dependent enzyme [Ktedonosporobacter rubrisoli]|uniref:Aminotransferase class III-fold pyridoxal phosphate-dependent enzyme n=1 Tax=Ktedonosporobacter rubrisoli TaxID=2509675 RepID=A0A4P6JRF3_KTERU|nr:aminotransferase class III-fold pyridoxal phosphate-dependent enzyme [Ktedonosporobacter rubrisoli]QBD78039.1 aminotransferase class III-fold pyridoxal phosphate-dependent enzyme [Ktedonosporobacter rubrisoli]